MFSIVLLGAGVKEVDHNSLLMPTQPLVEWKFNCPDNRRLLVINRETW